MKTNGASPLQPNQETNASYPKKSLLNCGKNHHHHKNHRSLYIISAIFAPQTPMAQSLPTLYKQNKILYHGKNYRN